mmetsp:Transcript_23397/g.23028  ORF Transcript_23397/g.23028 Transcript_23397/m.23028 type:complete len:83 (+) Transcript_23397:649-897(+)
MDYFSHCTDKYVFSVLPKGPGQHSNGILANLSLFRGDNSIFGDSKRIFGISEEGEYFMAGILSHLNAIVHFLAPSSNSLKRL